jgi:hypothetical protein
MPQAPNLVGEPPFTDLTVIERAGNKRGHALWLCRCVCGRTRKVTTGDLRSGRARACAVCTKTETVGVRERIMAGKNMFRRKGVLMSDSDKLQRALNLIRSAAAAEGFQRGPVESVADMIALALKHVEKQPTRAADVRAAVAVIEAWQAECRDKKTSVA